MTSWKEALARSINGTVGIHPTESLVTEGGVGRAHRARHLLLGYS
jgi:hypothetical protein